MNKLADFVHIEPKRSSIEVVCNVNTQHVSKTYYEFKVDLPATMIENDNLGGAIAPRPQIDFNVCPPCMIQFMGDAHQQISRMNELLT